MNVATREDIVRAVSERFGVVPMFLVPEVESGEVLVDSRGKGFLQRAPIG